MGITVCYVGIHGKVNYHTGITSEGVNKEEKWKWSVYIHVFITSVKSGGIMVYG